VKVYFANFVLGCTMKESPRSLPWYNHSERHCLPQRFSRVFVESNVAFATGLWRDISRKISY